MAKPRVLFLCTGNCCRSPLAEAILRHAAGDRFDVFSAGATPAGYIHPLTKAALESMHISADGLTSKSWDDLATQPFDLVITLCDFAAALGPPQFPAEPLVVHWPLTDPSAHPGDRDEQLEMCIRIAHRLKFKLEQFAALDIADRTNPELQTRLEMLADL